MFLRLTLKKIKDYMTKCILCNSSNFQELFQGKNWKALKCKKCGGTFYATERHTDDFHKDEIICEKCGRVLIIPLYMPAGVVL